MRDRRSSREAEYRARSSRAPSPRATVCAAEAKCPVAVGPITLTGDRSRPDFLSSDSGATWRVRPEARGAATPRRKEAL